LRPSSIEKSCDFFRGKLVADSPCAMFFHGIGLRREGEGNGGQQWRCAVVMRRGSLGMTPLGGYPARCALSRIIFHLFSELGCARRMCDGNRRVSPGFRTPGGVSSRIFRTRKQTGWQVGTDRQRELNCPVAPWVPRLRDKASAWFASLLFK
jgi:hypothetical protein